MTTMLQKASVISSKLNSDDTAKKVLHSAVLDNENAKKGPHLFYLNMVRVIGAEIMNSLPRVGSKDGNNPDVYDTTDTNGKKVEGSMSGDIADTTDEGSAIVQSMRNIQQSTEISDADKAERVAQFTQRRNRVRTIVRAAIRLHHHLADFREIDGISIGFAKTKVIVNEKPVEKYRDDTTKPLFVVDMSDVENGSTANAKYVSVGEFLSFKLDRAKAEIATGKNPWKAVVGSGKRGTKKKTGPAAQVKRIGSVDEAESYVAELAYWFGNIESAGKDSGYGKIMNKLANMPKGDERKHFILSLGRLYYGMDGIGVKIDAEYQRYVSEQSAMQAAGAIAA